MIIAVINGVPHVQSRMAVVFAFRVYSTALTIGKVESLLKSPPEDRSMLVLQGVSHCLCTYTKGSIET